MAETLKCPFVYATGKKCTGHIYRWTKYGRKDRDGKIVFPDVQRVQIWCSEKDNHAGIISGKRRMEFYPNQLPRPIFEAVFATDD